MQIRTGKLNLSIAVDKECKKGFTNIKFVTKISHDKEATATLLLILKSDDRHCQKC